MTRLFRATALTVALMLVAATPVLATRGQPDHEVPFGGGGTTADSYGDPGTCPPGAVWRFFSSGTNEFTHLGHVTVDVTHCTWVDWATGTGHFGPGTNTLTAVNGDTLTLSQWGTFESALTPDGIFSYVDLEWEVIGGTGRFEGASGTGEGTVVGDIAAMTSTSTYWGTIVYDASNRAFD
jgi:hypothetical protein